MTEQQTVELLEQHGIRPTANRIIVAKALAAAGRSMTLSELEYSILSIDKSGIFRALTLFREHRLVHVIEGGGEGVHYELCHSHHHDEDDDQHVHFYCERCQRTFCIDQVPMPSVVLPEGYVSWSSNYLIKGLCPDCKDRA